MGLSLCMVGNSICSSSSFLEADTPERRIPSLKASKERGRAVEVSGYTRFSLHNQGGRKAFKCPIDVYRAASAFGPPFKRCSHLRKARFGGVGARSCLQSNSLGRDAGAAKCILIYVEAPAPRPRAAERLPAELSRSRLKRESRRRGLHSCTSLVGLSTRHGFVQCSLLCSQAAPTACTSLHPPSLHAPPPSLLANHSFWSCSSWTDTTKARAQGATLVHSHCYPARYSHWLSNLHRRIAGRQARSCSQLQGANSGQL